MCVSPRAAPCKVDRIAVDLVHHDNRDFDVIPNYQPCCGPSFNEQTILLDKQPGVRCFFASCGGC